MSKITSVRTRGIQYCVAREEVVYEGNIPVSAMGRFSSVCVEDATKALVMAPDTSRRMGTFLYGLTIGLRGIKKVLVLGNT
jgi:hypothetical protein